MNANNKTNVQPQPKPLRLWPGVVIVILQGLIRFVIPIIVPDATAIGLFGGLLGGLAIVVWWIFFSRAPRFERWLAVALMIITLVAISHFNHKSIATAMMGMMFFLYSVPILCIAFVAWAVASRHLSKGLRQTTMVATILLASGFWVLLKTNGMDGEAHQDFALRWTKTSEDRLLTTANDKRIKMPIDSATMAKEAEWPGFRGRNRDGIIHGVRIKTDWSKSPPVEMWHQSVGPACSSFAIHGALLFTQEQRGEFEMVTCYNLNTGESVWSHRDSTRFWDAHAGAGPRSTPTLSNGRVYTLGATGILNVLDERDGTVVWSQNVAEQNKDVSIPVWGFTGSPLVADSVVIVALAGKILAYDLATGNQHWSGVNGGDSYSSPHLLTIDGIRQILFTNRSGLTSFTPTEGKELWKIPLMGIPIIQPALISDNNILISDVSDIGSKGMRRIAIKNVSGTWIVKEYWKSEALKPYFNDFVVHKGFVFSFEGPYLTCIDSDKGNRKWRGGRYAGELLLLADQDILLVLSEKGELALVAATPEQFKELARFPAIKGKTWNHPALADNILVVRNSQEMAAFRLPLDNE